MMANLTEFNIVCFSQATKLNSSDFLVEIFFVFRFVQLKEYAKFMLVWEIEHYFQIIIVAFLTIIFFQRIV